MPKVYFVTNRNPNRKHHPDNFGGGFNPEAYDNLRFGWANVVGKKIRSLVVAPEKLDADPAKAKLGSRQVFGELRRAMQRGRDTLAYVHGYNVTFAESLIAAGRLAATYGGSKDAKDRGPNVVVFSWPSDGSLLPFLAYKRDRSDAAASAPAFGRALLKLNAFLGDVRRGAECGARMHLVCHSMGAYVLRQGLQEARRVHDAVPRLFDHIFLMAADEDHDSFEFPKKLSPLPELCGAVHVYFNRGDTILVIADKTKANPTRLGSSGPRSPLTVPGNVNLIDASEVVGGLLEHDYHVSDKVVVRDVKAVLRGGAADQIRGRRYVAAQNRFVLGKGRG